MQVLPVLDLLNGHVVHGVAGRRDEYRPIVSGLTSSSNPLDVAAAMRGSFGLHRLYIADLDGILHQRPDLELYQRLIVEGFELLIDAGIRAPGDMTPILETGVTGLIVGLETCRSPEDLATIANQTTEVIFSLDLLHGQPRRRNDAQGWNDNPREIVRQVIEAKASAVLPLDLSDVGMGTGGSTDSLCQWIRNEFPAIGLIAGGGVRGPEDLHRLSELGVDAVLVASALHDGRLVRSDLDREEPKPRYGFR